MFTLEKALLFPQTIPAVTLAKQVNIKKYLKFPE